MLAAGNSDSSMCAPASLHLWNQEGVKSVFPREPHNIPSAHVSVSRTPAWTTVTEFFIVSAFIIEHKRQYKFNLPKPSLTWCLRREVRRQLLLLLLSRFSRVQLWATPKGRQPTRLLRPWDSPGKNAGVGCHLLLQRRLLREVQFLCNKFRLATTLQKDQCVALIKAEAHAIKRII